jgi:hypothetical protein
MTGTRRTLGSRSASAVVLTIVWLAGFASAANANTFHAFSCQDPYTMQAAPADDWRYDEGTSGYGDGAGSSCSGGQGAISAWMDGAVTHGFGEGGAATFTAPDGLTITEFQLWRYEAVGPVEPYAAPATNIAYDPGNVSVEGLCAQSLGCTTRGDPQQREASGNEVGASGLTGVTQIQASAVCGGGPGTQYVCPTSNAENGNSAEVDLYAADIVLDDTTIPTVTNVSGPLVSGGTLTGTPTVSFTASDSGSGVYSGTISADGKIATQRILDTNGGACESLNVTGDGMRSFNHPQPCKAQVSGTLALDTTRLNPGAHSVQVTVDDASGNTTTVWDGNVATVNPSIPNGTPACPQAHMTLTTNGKHRPIVIRYGTRTVVKGQLVCGGTPVADAVIGLTGARHGPIETGPGGEFTYKVPTGPNRALRFSYTAYSNETAPAATARAQISVLPRIRLKIAPRRTHNGATIGWRGEIAGGPFPGRGVTLLVEVREGRRWQVFDQVVARRGRFRYRYTFLRTLQPTTYTFRVALPAGGSSGYHYRPAGSNTIKIHVR